MGSLPMPYQCLQTHGRVLYAACGARIDTFSLENGMLLSTWNSQISLSTGSFSLRNRDTTVTSAKDGLDSASPQAKRRRLSDSGSHKEASGGDHGGKLVLDSSSSNFSGTGDPTIINMTGTKNGQYLVVVTGEDKTIRVLQWESTSDSNYSLNEKSLRVMPKRPCAIAITKDDCTIISADKYGDVYALPLIETKIPSGEHNEIKYSNISRHSGLTSQSKPFKPAASDLTVHSVRNLKALQNQLRHINRVSGKSEPDFEHRLLLGHVSMLTDLTLVTLDGRDYIITADRDEHIRISRGIPQSHIVEGYCLGHSEFVSRLCIPESRPNILISGGGENALFIWDWRLEELITRENLSTYTDTLVTDSTTTPEANTTLNTMNVRTRMIAVSGIHHVTQTLDESSRDIIMATCEGIPAVIVFVLAENNHLQHLQTLNLAGNALSVAVNTLSAQRLDIVVSIDTVHVAGTTTKIREESTSLNRLQNFTFVKGELNSSFQFEEVKDGKAEMEGLGGKNWIKETIYNLESLRKREGDSQTQE